MEIAIYYPVHVQLNLHLKILGTSVTILSLYLYAHLYCVKCIGFVWKGTSISYSNALVNPISFKVLEKTSEKLFNIAITSFLCSKFKLVLVKLIFRIEVLLVLCSSK